MTFFLITGFNNSDDRTIDAEDDSMWVTIYTNVHIMLSREVL